MDEMERIDIEVEKDVARLGNFEVSKGHTAVGLSHSIPTEY